MGQTECPAHSRGGAEDERAATGTVRRARTGVRVRLGLAAIATALGLSVVWVYAALMGDYITKAAMLGWRFYRGRWKKAIPS